MASIYIHALLGVININMEKFEKFIKTYYVLIFIFLVGLILIIGPFMLSNNLQGFDAPGHYASAYYIKNFFWPWPDGWNMMLLAGFPQGIFYPSLFHWLIAALSFFIPMIWAYKLIVVIPIILFPVVFFILAKSVFKDAILASVCLSLAALFYYFDLGLNDNLFADIYFGMFPHLVSLTLFFAYLYFLFKVTKEGKYWLWAAVFLAFNILTHAFTGLAAILFSLVTLFFYLGDRELLFKIIWHLILATFLTAFWWLPMIINVSYMSGSDIGSGIAPILIVVMPFVLGLSIVSIRKKDNNLFLKTISAFNLLILVAFLLGRLFPVNNFPVHFSRFLVYPMMLAPFSLIHVLKQKINWRTLNFILLFVICFYFFFFKIIPVGPFDLQALEGIRNNSQTARIFVSGDSRYLDDRYHATRMHLAMNEKVLMSEGLFVESSANGWFIMSMMKSWDQSTPSFVWAYMDLESVTDLSWGSNILGINYEYRLNDVPPSKEEDFFSEKFDEVALSILKKEDINFENNIHYHAQNLRNFNFKNNRLRLLDNEDVINLVAGEGSPFYYQSFYKVGDNYLAETLDLRPVEIKNDWLNKTRKWWSSDWLRPENDAIFGPYRKPILIYRQDPLDWNLAHDKEGLDLIFYEDKMDFFQVDASSLEESVPVYVKVSYFPFWKAYNEDGEELDIYRASPNFMLVYARGMIDFYYIKPWYYYLAFYLSIISLFITLALMIARKIKK